MILIFKNKISNKGYRRPAFSLIEVIIATALFSVLIISASSIFKMTIDNQRRAIATQNVQESLKYFLEVIAKEIRMAQPDIKLPPCEPSLPLAKGKIFYVLTGANNNDQLKFKNYYNECVAYYLENDRFYIKRNGLSLPISPEKIKIKGLRFILGASTTAQELITINMQAEAVGSDRLNSEMILQTSLSSRYYKEID